MRSRTTPKVLHGFAGRSLLGHVLAAVEPVEPAATVVVVGHGRESVRAHLAEIAPRARTVVQEQQRGTGHAVRVAMEALESDRSGAPVALTEADVLVLPGDTPLLTSATITALLDRHADGAEATVLTSVMPDPTGYGRVVRDPHGRVARIVEHRDANADQLSIGEVNTSVYVFRAAALIDAVGRLSTANDQGEEYLTDVIEILVGAGRPVEAVVADALETGGVNDRVQLAAAHRSYNQRCLDAHMRAGVTVIDPATTWVDADVTIGADAVLRPGTELRGHTTVAEGAEVGPQTTLTDTAVGAGARLDRTVAVSARIGAGVTAGPFAYLRPGTVLGEDVHIGTYVELKNSQVGAGAKVPHLSYVGDATIGEQTNIGAATVFVNYDGVDKHRTVVGRQVRIGSDTMLIAPVTVGDGAYTAAGSVIDHDVAPGDLGVARARQRNVSGWVGRRRAGTAADRAAQDALGAQQTTQVPDDASGDQTR